MELSDKLKEETRQRAKLADSTKDLPASVRYTWSLAVIHLSYVSDYSGFVGLLQEHVDLVQKHTKKYAENSFPDIIVEGSKPDELYVLMYGPKADAVSALDGFFDNIDRLQPDKWILGARFGVAEYDTKSTADSMIDSARKRPIRHDIGKVPGVYSKPALTGGLGKVV